MKVNTNDGLCLNISPNGRVTSVANGRQSVPPSSAQACLYVRDVCARTPFVPVQARAAAQKRGCALSGSVDELDLAIEAHLEPRSRYIAVSGVVRNLSGRDRCIDLKSVLPVDCKGWLWGRDLVGEEPIRVRKRGVMHEGVTVYPLAAVSDPRSGIGLSLAVPPTYPTLFDTGVDATGLYVSFRIGLSDATNPPSVTPFRLIIYRHDPAWGFRSSLKRYYDFFRVPFFTLRVDRFGAWSARCPSSLNNPDLYAYHEAGHGTWPRTARHEGHLRAKTVRDFEVQCELADDRRDGRYALPYTIVGQRQVFRLPRMPRGYAAAMAALEEWDSDEIILFQSPGPAISFSSVAQLKEIIRNSGIHDEAGRFVIDRRNYLGKTLTFPQNPNPKLFADSDRDTVAKYTLDEYLPMMFEGSPLINGCYVDSLGKWCGYFSRRKEHFRYSTVPLTYAGDPPRVCLWSAQSHAEYLWELSKRLHADGKIVFGNGVHTDRVMLGFTLDAMGTESLPTYHNRDSFYSRRVAAASKPYCVLNGRQHDRDLLWNSSLYLGYLLACNSPEAAEKERRYLPAMIRLNEAGWEPITHAWASPKGMWAKFRWDTPKWLIHKGIR